MTTMLQPGDTFGAYRIVARLKAGGMARLYLARREGAAGFARPVALKVIHPHLARQQDFVQMFIDEARLSAKIHDPNVVHVEDLGELDNTLFMAMEYVHGTALSRVLTAASELKRRLTPVFVTHLIAAIASGLHAAHETKDESNRPLGIVHRDVSPHNVLVSYKGHVKLIDFGVAKALRKSHDTVEGAIQGKIAYMPPEQALGNEVDRRADIYALGIVLWELLVGRRLFQADNDLALLDRVRNPRVDRPSMHVDLPRALDDVTMALLEPDLNDRPATALEVKRMLLDAVPQARALESDEVAAVLHALLAEQIGREDAMLASLSEEEAPSMPTLTHGSPLSEEKTLETLEREKKTEPWLSGLESTLKVEPSLALEHLTVEIDRGEAGIVVPPATPSLTPAASVLANAATGPMRLRAPRRRSSTPLVVGLVALFGALAATTVLVAQRPDHPPAVFPPPPVIVTSDPTTDNALSTSTSTATPTTPTATTMAAAATATATATASTEVAPAVSAQRPVRLKPRPRPAAAAASSSATRKAPRTVGGVELYEE